MNVRRNMLAAALLVALGASTPVWAGDTCALLDIAGITAGNGGSSAILGDPDSIACGTENQANGTATFAFGAHNTVDGAYGNAFGLSNHVGGEYGNVFGSFSRASADYSNAFGSYNHADGNYSNAFGTDASTGPGADYSIAFGAGDFTNPLNGGASVAANVTSAIAIGHTVKANANDSVAMGHNSVVDTHAVGAVALGAGAIASETNTLSVGHTATDINPTTYVAYGSALDRRIVNVAAGTADTDAVNVGQMRSYVASRAGGVSPWFVGTGDPAITDGSDYPIASGKHDLAMGAGSKAIGEASSAVGYGNTAASAQSGCASCLIQGNSAFGTSNQASGGAYSNAFGSMNVASFNYSNAFGSGNTASAYESSAFGISNTASIDYGSAFGYQNTASAHGGSAFGNANTAGGLLRSSAFGYANAASANNSSAFGNQNAAEGESSVAFGYGNYAAADDSVALGHGNTASGYASSALGYASQATGTSAIALGGWRDLNGNGKADPGIDLNNDGVPDVTEVTSASGDYSTAVGTIAVASGDNSGAFGYSNTASGSDSSAFGNANSASGETGSAFGFANLAGGNHSSAFGGLNTASGEYSNAMGYESEANGDFSNAFGSSPVHSAMGFPPHNVASGDYSNAFGFANHATGKYSSAVGALSVTGGGSDYSIAFGAGNPDVSATDGAGVADNVTSAIAIGHTVSVNADDGIAMGHNATVQSGAIGAVALGSGSVADTANTISVGSSGSERRIVNVAAGHLSANSTDAVNGSQLYATNQAVSAVGQLAGKGWNVQVDGDTATRVKPGDTMQFKDGGNIAVTRNGTDITVSTVDSPAFGNVTVNAGGSGRVTGVTAGIDETDAVNVKQLDDAVAHGVGQGTALAVEYDGAAKSSITLAGSGGTAIVNVKAGDISSDGSTEAVNGGQLHATNQLVGANASNIATNKGDIADNQTAIATHATAITTLENTAVFYADAAHAQVVFGTTGTPVTLSNVAAGTAPTDAVNKAQLDAVAAQTGRIAANAVTYDGSGKTDITLAGSNGTAIHHVAAGRVATDAVNKGQLDAVGAQVTGNTASITANAMDIAGNTTAIHDLDGRVTTVENQVGQLQQATTTLSYLAVDGKGDGSDAAHVLKGGHGVVIGSNASAGGDHGTAVGGDSYAAGANDTALGGNATVNADGSTAVGANTTVAHAATNAVAVGEGANVDAVSGVALGQGASVAAAGAVALGQGSIADQSDTVSVGTAKRQRRVTNVAAGKGTTDAVNKGQLDAVTAQAVQTAKQYAQTGDNQTLRQANAYTDQQIQAAMGGDVAAFRRNVNDRFYQVNRRVDRLSAMQSAAAQMAINAAGAQSNGRLAVGVGFSSGKSALSVGYGAPLGKRFHVSFGATASGSEASAGIGFGVDL